MDNLKKYIQQHNEQMDFDDPSPELWNKIENNAAHKKSNVLPLLLRYAAAAALITAVIVAAIQLSGKKENAAVAVNDTPPIDILKKIIADSAQPALTATTDHSNPVTDAAIPENKTKETKQVDQRYSMMESFKENYGHLVNYQLKSIRSTPVYAEDQAYFDDFKTRLKQMDMDEATIRKTIRRQGMSNTLLEQLINVYQEKLNVLKALQAEINKMNERVKENEPADSLNKYYLNI